MATKKLIGVLAVSGSVLALGTTVALASGGDGQESHHPSEQTQRSAYAGMPHAGPAPEEAQRGPVRYQDGPWPEHCTDEDPAISSDRAREIALEKVPGATVTEVDLDRCYLLEWDLELHQGNTEYELGVDARTGEIVEFEQEQDDD